MIIPLDEIEAFWEVTRDCLIQFHGLTPGDAAGRVAALRADLDTVKLPGDPMIYHDEPFNVACGLAGQELDRFEPAVAEEYHRMLDRPFPVLDGGESVAVHAPRARRKFPRDEAEAYWAVARDCLIQFHGMASDEARLRVDLLRERLARTGVPMVEEMIYHAEPFYVACNLAGAELDPFKFDEEYQRLLERPFPVVGNVAAVREPGHEYRTDR